MNFKVGDTASLSKTITDDAIRSFAELVGDHNSLHLDDEYSRKTRFGRRVAHGMLSASLISTVIGVKLPGSGTIYLSQTFKFVAPVYPDDTVTARVTITNIREDKSIVTLETVCLNQHDELVVKGEAVVLVENID
jgi:3-hydroxybutyryl-CoA dehydratase